MINYSVKTIIQRLSVIGILLSVFAASFGQQFQYPFGFQGMERDDDVKGKGNAYATHYRPYDARSGRWISVDPALSYDKSPYNGLANNPLLYIDPKGDTITLQYNPGIQDQVDGFVEWMSGFNPDAITYNVNAQGQLTYNLVDASRLTAYDRTMMAAIDDPDNVVFRMTYRNRRVILDQYRTGQIDLHDLRQGSEIGTRMNLFHIVAERFASPNYERRRIVSGFQANFNVDHDAALQQEAAIYGELLGDPSIQFVRDHTDLAAGYGRFVFRSQTDPGLTVVRILSGARIDLGPRWTLDRGGVTSRVFVLRDGVRTPIEDAIPGAP